MTHKTLKKIFQSLSHPIVHHLVDLRKNKAYRKENRSCVIEGKKMIQEVAKTHKIKKLLTTDDSFKIPADETYNVPLAVIEKIAGSKNPEPYVAEIEIPPETTLKGSFIVALDGVNDPGNVGTIIRTALALNWDGIFLLPNCCDPYNDKALRSSKGALFRIPCVQGTWDELAQLSKNNSLQILVADGDGESVETASKHPTLLILGSESHGVQIPTSLQEELKTKKIAIPMKGDMESLNVAIAGAILLYRLQPTGAL